MWQIDKWWQKVIYVIGWIYVITIAFAFLYGFMSALE